MADIGEDFTLFEILAILIAIGGLGYGAWYLYNQIAGNSGDTNDPTTGQSNGPLNALSNAIFPESFPGGGEVTGSAETFTGAVSETVSDPIGTLKSIFGIGQNG